MTWEGPAAIVQSGGIQPVAAMPLKLVEAVGADEGSSDVSMAASATPVLDTSSFPPESADALMDPFASLAFSAESLSMRNRSSEIG